jgi:putative membrane protein
MNSLSAKQELQDRLARPPLEPLARRLRLLAWVLTAIVLLLVGAMRRPELRIPLPEGISLSFLPGLHASLNAITACLLIAAVMAIKRQNVRWHQRLMTLAMLLSILFLVSYVAYHFTHTETLFGDRNGDHAVDAQERELLGWTRPVYLVLLLSHIALAAVGLPAILFTFIAAWTHQWSTHRRLAVWVFPIWLYVAVTGPVCYWMLIPYYR